MKIIIRNSAPQDWQTLQGLNHKIMFVNKKFDPFFNIDWEYTNYGKEYFQAMAATKTESCCFIVEVDYQPVGYLNGEIKHQGYRVNSIKSAELINVAVLPKYQSQGIGSKLITKFKIWALTQGATHLLVDAFYKNTQAIKFYKKLNLKPINIILEGKI